MAQGKNIPRCHFLLIVIVIAIILIYKEFFKTMKISRIFFRIGLVKILIFCLFPKVIQYNTDYFMVIKKYIKEYSLEEKYHELPLKDHNLHHNCLETCCDLFRLKLGSLSILWWHRKDRNGIVQSKLLLKSLYLHNTLILIKLSYHS